MNQDSETEKLYIQQRLDKLAYPKTSIHHLNESLL